MKKGFISVARPHKPAKTQQSTSMGCVCSGPIWGVGMCACELAYRQQENDDDEYFEEDE